jgi:PAS domain S-box-containing protein
MFSELEERVAKRTAELASSNKRYQNFIENSAEGIWLLSFYEPIALDLPYKEQVDLIQKNGYVAECNESLAKMYGYSSREEMIGKNLLKDLYGGQATEANTQSTLKLVRAGYRSPDRLTEEVNKKGERVYFMNNAVGEIQDGYLIGIWGVQRDVTKLKQIEAERERFIAELENKNDELERFTYTVSHDLKAPIITIRGFLGYLEEDIQSANPERIKSDVDRIKGATDKMLNLLDNLLELSRIGRMINPPVTVPLETIARDAINLVTGHIDAQGVQVEIASGLPTVLGDQTRLTQVLQNLVDNAVKFMGDQPEPRIEIGQQGRDSEGNPIFFVRDNGIGIAPEHQERVFGLFNKLNTETTGTGIGLALVKRIIEVHGGRIWVESEGLGKGSTFCFTIPGTQSF